MPLVRERGELFLIVYDADGEAVVREKVVEQGDQLFLQRAGALIPYDVRDENEFAKQRQLNSHEGYIKSFADDKNAVKRSNALKRRVETMVAEMTAPPANVEFRTISDEAFIQLMQAPDTWALDGFTPIQLYFHKLNKIGRRPYKGEVGMVEDPETGKLLYYLLLEKGYERVSIPVSKHLPAEVIAASVPNVPIIGEEPPKEEPPVPPPPTLEGVQAYTVKTPDGGRAVLYGVDDNDALEAALSSNIEDVPERAAEFDRCGTHTIMVMAGGRLLCKDCGASS